LDKADLDRHEQNIIALSKEDNKSNSASSKIDQPAFLSEKTGLKEQEDIESTKAEKELKRGNNIADIQKNNGINEGYNREINNEKREKSIGIDSGENDGINKTSIAKNSSQLASTEVETGTRNKNKAVENESSGTKANTSNPSDLTKPDIAKGFNLVSKDNQVIEGERNSIAKSKELVQNYVAELNPVAPKGGQEKEVRLKKMYLYFWQNESLYAQVEIKKENKMKGKRWSANADFTPSYTNQNFEVANTTSPSPGASGAFADAFRTTSQEESAKELEMLSKPQFSYSSGVNSAYRITERLSVEVGVKYIYSQSKVYTNNYVENMTTNDQYPAFNMVLKETPSEEASLYNWNPGTEPEANALYGYNSVRAATNNLSSPSNIDNYKDVNIYTQYVGVPLTINYKLIDKRIGISIGGGVSTDFFLQYGSKKQDGLEAEKISSAENSVFRPYAFSFLLTPEFEYGLSERSSFYLRPIYKGALQSFTDDKKLSNRPNSTGIGFGIRYNFR
jgi:hypothetical protein